MFADRGLDFGRYQVWSRHARGKYNCFVFTDAGDVEIGSPIRVVFSDEWQIPLIPNSMQRSRLSPPNAKKAQHFFGPFATVMRSETVIFYDIVGYQQHGVSEEFYERFRPDDVTCLAPQVESIYQLTDPELRAGFKRDFMDNWIDGRSFVIISY
jgi:hypothetical protein